MYTYICIGVFNIIIRILISGNYQRRYFAFTNNSKEIKSKKDIKDTRSRFLNLVVKDYMMLAEKGISSINTRAIVNKHILRFNFFGWSLKSMEKFSGGFENILLLIGVLFAVLFMPLQWSVLSVLVFVISKLLITIFDFELVKEKLTEEAIAYVEREIGQFFPSDLPASVNVFKTEMKDVLNTQTKTIKDTMIKSGSDLSNAIIISVNETNKNIEKTLASVTDKAEILNEPLEKWKNIIEQSQKLQTESNKHYASLCETVEALNMNNRELELKNKAFEEQLEYVQKNQLLLEKSVQQYEQTFMEISSKMGDTLGSIVEYSLKNAYSQISDNINSDFNRLLSANSELIIRLNEMFNEMVQQSRNEATAIMAIKDQMDMHFEKN